MLEDWAGRFKRLGFYVFLVNLCFWLLLPDYGKAISRVVCDFDYYYVSCSAINYPPLRVVFKLDYLITFFFFPARRH